MRTSAKVPIHLRIDRPVKKKRSSVVSVTAYFERIDVFERRYLMFCVTFVWKTISVLLHFDRRSASHRKLFTRSNRIRELP
jgi:hypothetical protein